MQTCIWREGTETFCGYRAPTGVSLCHCAERVFFFPNQMLKERKSNGSCGQRGSPRAEGVPRGQRVLPELPPALGLAGEARSGQLGTEEGTKPVPVAFIISLVGKSFGFWWGAGIFAIPTSHQSCRPAAASQPGLQHSFSFYFPLSCSALTLRVKRFTALPVTLDAISPSLCFLLSVSAVCRHDTV